MHARTLEEIARYLERHPGEHERLRALRAQIAHDEDIFSRANMAGHITASVGEGAHRHHDVLFAVVATRPFTPRPQLEEVDGVEWMPIADFLALPGRRMQHLVPKLRALLDPAPAAAPRNAPFDPNR